MATWRIYYGDGSTYSDEDGSPFDAPPLNVQVILCHDPSRHGRGFWPLARFDYYWWTGDAWHGGDVFGLWDYLASSGPKTVKFGRSIPTDDYYAIRQRAKADPIAKGAEPCS